ncbi:MAG: transglycosylase domain-containing protein [Bacteroidales bacterium]|nr:transglycosylase domain-containing protein [Bacteroidales bacterium]
MFQSQQLFDALPDGLFTNLKGIKTNGTIDYSLDFKVRLDNPDSVYLNPKLITRSFGLVQYGYRNFSALNDTFSHDVYDEGQYIRTIRIDPSNKNFKRLDEISPFIINAVVTLEDGGFFTNQGFDLDAFKYAISENIKQKRYARGGSTITMQLVKNLYLNKSKNLFRKAEEYLIVWLIENQAIVPKERLLEIYLNIIEWGPNIYGVSEACQYYFSKSPKDVTLDEALYLASIVPRPKKFKYLFEKDGNLKSFMEDDFKFVSNKMLSRGMISEDQFNDLTYNIKLNGQAKNMLADTASTISDSISIDEISIERDTALLLP